MKLKLLFFFLSHMGVIIFAQENSKQNSELPKVNLKIDLPLFDLPYQVSAADTVRHGFFSSYANPGMAQSSALAYDLFSGFHYGMKCFYDNTDINETLRKIIFFGGTALGDYLLMYMPGGNGWAHEEFHRAVMSRFGINSFNGMNRFPAGEDIVSVSNVTDSDLIRFKKESPIDFIRMHVAGIEGEYLLLNNLQRNNFFYNQKLMHESEYWLITLNSHLYVWGSSQANTVDVQTKEMNNSESDISSRDFTGFDMTAWVYDIFRPNEPYEARGTHPLGNGINRYRTTKDLTGAELRYLRMQGYLQLLNYLSPMMFYIKTIPFGDSGFSGNFAMRHYLTSFGNDIMANVFLKYRHFNMAFAYHSYTNYEHYFPAIEAELVDFPLNFGKFGMYISPRVLIGIQPANQEFRTGSPEFLGLLGLRVDFRVSKHFLPYLDFTAKTDGWVAGNEFLEANASIRMGVSARF